MRILHVINTYAPVTNGVTVSVAGWADALRRSGHEVAVWTVGGIQPEDGATDVHRVRGFGRLAPGFPIPSSLTPPPALRRAAWDVVHIHHPVLLGPAAARYARRIGAACVATAHSDYLGYLDEYVAPAKRIARAVTGAQIRGFFNHVDLVFAPSASIGSALSEWGVTRPVVPTTYPVDVSGWCALSRAEARRALGLDDETPVALFVGRMAPDKRVLRLLDEFAVARTAVPSARLELVGGGPLLAQVRHLASRYGGSVRIHGEVAQSQLGALYRAADVFVSASRNEVGPLAAIEAGLCGVPSVAFRVPGFADRVVDGESGWLAPDHRGALGQAMAAALGDVPAAHDRGEAMARSLLVHTPTQAAEVLERGYRAASARRSADASEGVRASGAAGERA